MESLWQDLRFGLRSLRKNPGLTLVAVLSLGVGIGANATVFTWLNAFVLRPLPAVPEYSRLVAVNTRAPGGGDWSVSYPSLVDWRAASRSVDLTAAEFFQVGLRGENGSIERAWGGLVGGNYFDVLRVPPVLGRTLTLRDEQERRPVVVLGYSFWQRRFPNDSAVLGRHLILNGHDLEVVGVMAPRFGGTNIGLRFDMFFPVTLQPLLTGTNSLDRRGNEWLDGFARIRTGFTIAQAREELDQVVKRVARETGDDDSKNGVNVKPMSEQGAGSFLSPIFYALLGVTGVVLLIACANVANLLLARALARRREIGIRLALGADRTRLVRQLFTESLALGLLAGGVGVFVAFWCRDLVMTFVPPSPFPIAMDIDVNARVLIFALAITLVASIMFGLLPAVQASNPALVPTLKDEIGGGTAHRGRLQSSLVVVQVALSLVSLVCAGLFIRSLDASRRADLGFTGPEKVLLISTDQRLAGVPDSLLRAQEHALLEKVRAVPGVEFASVAMHVPLGFGGQSSMSVAVDGYVPQPQENTSIEYLAVGSDYFPAQGVPILRGRGIQETDVEGGLDVVVVNEQFAARFFRGADALGKQFRQGGKMRTIVGVAKQGVYHNLNDPPRGMVYYPYSQMAVRGFDVLVRTAGNPLALVPAVRAAFKAANPDLPVLDVRTMAEHMQAALFVQKLGATMLAGFGLMALLLSAIGIYGVISYAVSQRTREIGVRVALGAARRDVMRMVVGRAMRLTGIGLVFGLAAAFGAGQLLGSQLVGVSPRDPVTYVGIAVLLGMVALVAGWLPARRAAKVDPMVALRHQ